MKANDGYGVCKEDTKTLKYSIDLHTHTMYSGDSSTTVEEYLQGFSRAGLSLAAITDHLTIQGAVAIKGILGEKIVVGQEIRVKEGELIGLYLSERISPGLSGKVAAQAIHSQGGLVYIPHPGDKTRASMSQASLMTLINEGYVDVVEVGNSKLDRSSLSQEVVAEILETGAALASSSDAHVPEALGSSHTVVATLPSCADDLKRLLKDPETILVHNHFDPARKWRAKIVPSQLGSIRRATS